MAWTLYWIAHLTTGWPGNVSNDSAGGAKIVAGNLSDDSAADLSGSEGSVTSGSGTITEATAQTGSYGTSYSYAMVLHDGASGYSNVINGSLTTNINVTLAVSGSVVFSGTETVKRVRAQIPSGSVVFSGAVDVLHERSITPAGDITFSGTAPFQTSAEFVISPSGSVVFSGSIELTRLRALVPAGDITFSGTQTLLRTRAAIPAGSVDFSGTNIFARTRVSAPAGQVTFQGHAALIFRPFDAIDGQYVNRLTIGVSRANRLS